MIVGHRLRSLRKMKGLSQQELGKLLNVSKVSVCCYENGSRIPSLDIFIKMLNYFGVSSDYLLGRELGMVCESDDSDIVYASKDDIEIIKELKEKIKLYNHIAENPKRFFSTFDSKK